MAIARIATFSRRPFQHVALRNNDICHTTSDTRPSRFSACNIEKLGVAWRARLGVSDFRSVVPRSY